jgi:lipopolysaccharide export system protein LptA
MILLFALCYTVSADSSVIVDSTSYLYGNVRFIHEDLEITSKTATITQDRVIVRDSVTILKDELEILTDFGEYFWNEEIRLHDGFRAHKKHEVVVGKEGRYLDNKLWVTGAVEYINADEDWVVRGEQGFYDSETRCITMSDSPRFESQRDSIKIFGDTIRVFGDTLTRVINNAIIEIGETHCFADILVYMPKKDQALLHGNPCIVSQADSLQGEYMTIMLSDREIEQVVVQGDIVGKRWEF